MLPPFAVAELVHHEDQAARPRPGHAHVLQFALRLRIVMAVDNQDARHRLIRLGRGVEVGGDEHARPALENDVLNAIAVAVDGAGDARLDLLRRLGELTERAPQRLDAPIAVVLPLDAIGNLVPNLRLAPIGEVDAGMGVAAQHSRQFLGLVGVGLDHAPHRACGVCQPARRARRLGKRPRGRGWPRRGEGGGSWCALLLREGGWDRSYRARAARPGKARLCCGFSVFLAARG